MQRALDLRADAGDQLEIVGGGRALDAGRTCNGGNPPKELRFGDVSIPNPRKNSPPRTLLGARQKKWFLDQLRRSSATWKIWGNSQGTLDLRADPQNLPDGMTKRKWPADTYAQIGSYDFGSAYHERGEFRRAVAAYDVAIRIEPNIAMYYIDRGNSLSYAGDTDRAIDDLTRAIDIDPKNPDAYFRRGNLQRERGNFDAAIGDYDKAAELAPDELRYRHAREAANKMKGDARAAESDHAEALRVEADRFQQMIRSVSKPPAAN